MARPPKVSPDTVARLTDAIRAGNYYEAACAYARISYNTMRNWIKRAEAERDHIAAGGKPRKSEVEFLELLEALEKAEADAEVRLVAQWQQHAPSSWQACRDFLARRFPERWGKTVRAEVSGPGGQPLLGNSAMTPDEALAMLRQAYRDTHSDGETGDEGDLLGGPEG